MSPARVGSTQLWRCPRCKRLNVHSITGPQCRCGAGWRCPSCQLGRIGDVCITCREARPPAPAAA